MISLFGRRPKLLLVNNNRRETGVFAGFVSDGEYEVLTASAAEGVVAARAEKPALIVLDCELPRNSGWETLSALKHDKNTSGIPVLMRAMRGDDEAAAMALSGGAQGYLTRRDSPAVVAGKIARRLGRARGD